jgi:hypothetical protein
MNFSTYRFTLDLQKHKSQISIAAFQYDTAIKLIIGLTDGGVPYHLDGNLRAELYGKKPSGNAIVHDCSIEENSRIIYTFNKTTANEIGVINCQICIYDANDEQVSAPKFTIVVGEKAVSDDDVFEDEDFEGKHSALDAIFASESERVEAENNRVEAESKRVKAEKERVKAEEEREKAFEELPKNTVDKSEFNALEERVTDLESLTLTYIEDGSTAYEKVVPANVGSKALIKAIGGATERVFGKNLINPADIEMPEEVDSYTINADGTITYTINKSPTGFAFISLNDLPVGRYYFYVEGICDGSWNFLEDNRIEMYVMSDFDESLNDGAGDYVDTTRTLKAMLWRDESVTTDTWEVVEAPEGTVFEPYHEPYLQDAEVERVESIGANLIPFPYRDFNPTMNGITVTTNADGTLVLNGTWNNTTITLSDFTLHKKMILPEGEYTIGGCEGGANYTYRLFVWITRSDGTPAYYSVVNKPITFSIFEGDSFDLIIRVGNEIGTVSNLVIKPMLVKGETAIPFKPYKPEPIDTFVIPIEAIKAKVRGFGIGDTDVYNSVEVVDKTVTYSQRLSEETVLQNNSYWASNKETDDYISFALTKTYLQPKMKATSGASIKCLGLPVKSWSSSLSLSEDFLWRAPSSIGVCIAKSKLEPYGSLDNAGAKVKAFGAWLNENPIHIIYELANPEVTDITDLFTEDNAIEVERGGVLRFVNKDKMPVPSSVWFTTRKE